MVSPLLKVVTMEARKERYGLVGANQIENLRICHRSKKFYSSVPILGSDPDKDNDVGENYLQPLVFFLHTFPAQFDIFCVVSGWRLNKSRTVTCLRVNSVTLNDDTISSFYLQHDREC